jgi:predicted amidohydrolase
MKIRVGQIKIEPAKGDLDKNHALLLATLEAISDDSPDVVVVPECFLDGYVVRDRDLEDFSLRDYAIDPKTSPYTALASSWAKASNSWLIYGCSRVVDDGIYNSALIYDRNGDLAGIYDKVHVDDPGDEDFLPGTSLASFEGDFGRFGVMICADRRWPETARTLALQGARIIFNPSFGFYGDLNTCMMRTRSFENGLPIVFTHPNESLITDASGEIVCQSTSTESTYSVTEVELGVPPRFDHLSFRRAAAEGDRTTVHPSR